MIIDIFIKSGSCFLQTSLSITIEVAVKKSRYCDEKSEGKRSLLSS